MIEFLSLDGESLFVERHAAEANRPTLAFLHDSLGSTAQWRDFPEKLAADIHASWMSYDRPGHGQSGPLHTSLRPVNYMEKEAERLVALLDHLAIEKPILFGHSDGGTIALWAGALFPHRFRALVVEAAHIFVEPETLEGIRETIEAYHTTDLPRKLAKYHGLKTDTLFRAWAETWTRPDYRDWSIEPLLKNIGCPVLFIQGTDDNYGTLRQARQTLAGVSGPSESCILPHTGHAPHKEYPEAVRSHTVAFLHKHTLVQGT